MLKYFAVFCKNCGSYEIKISYNNDEEIILECEICDVAEPVEP